jgi:hypothetical protein
MLPDVAPLRSKRRYGKVTLSDRFIQSPKRVPASGRADWSDALVPGMALRVSANGHRSFVLFAKYPPA